MMKLPATFRATPETIADVLHDVNGQIDRGELPDGAVIRLEAAESLLDLSGAVLEGRPGVTIVGDFSKAKATS